MEKKAPVFNFNIFFIAIISLFVVVMAFVACQRGGRDLKVGLFGAIQTLEKKSPYDNPTDPDRPLFRYAPGFAILQYPFLLKAKMTSPFEFENITLSVLLWYLIKIVLLFITGFMLFRLIPCVSKEMSLRNLKISFLLALPLIGYELSNSQNKLPALFFIIASIYFFERDRRFIAAIFFSIALTIYIPLVFFILYFILKDKKFIFSFITAVFIVFIVLPSLVFGFNFNIYLLKEWFDRAIKPFMLTNSYSSYIDLRASSQSLSSAVGRMFVSGSTGNFKYLISPNAIHIIIKALSAIIVLFSGFAIWKQSKDVSKGLGYSIFLILALILPQYCIYYTWGWVFVLYFSVFNYISYPGVASGKKKILLSSVCISFLSICLIGFSSLKHLFLIFWATVIMWLGMAIVSMDKSDLT